MKTSHKFATSPDILVTDEPLQVVISALTSSNFYRLLPDKENPATLGHSKFMLVFLLLTAF